MAIIGFIYQPVEPPNKWERQSDSENGWHEMEWMDLARMPRFWPGFIEAFLQKPDVRSDMIKYFAELENISESKMKEMLDDPIQYRDRLADIIYDWFIDNEIWEGADEPFIMILENTPGYFDYTAQVINDTDIYFRINELVTDETPKAAPSRIEFNHNTLKQLAKALGVDLKFVINRREV